MSEKEEKSTDSNEVTDAEFRENSKESQEKKRISAAPEYSYEDLAKKIGQNQRNNIIFIQNMNYVDKNDGFVAGNIDNIQNIDFGYTYDKSKRENQKCPDSDGIFSNKETLTRWCSENYAEYNFAFLVAGTVFHDMPYSWICSFARKLLDNSSDKEEFRPLVSRSILLKVCEMELYTGYIVNESGRMAIDSVRINNDSNGDLLLECICTEFSELRDKVYGWLNGYIFSGNWSISMRAIQMVARIASYDYEYFKNVILPNLQKEKNLQADFAVGKIMAEMSKDERYKENIGNIIKYWGTINNNIHYNLTALICHVKMRSEEKDIVTVFRQYFDEVYREALAGDYIYLDYLQVIYALGDRWGGYYRAMVLALDHNISKPLTPKDFMENSDVLETLFYLFVMEDYSVFLKSNRKKEMIFVKLCCFKNNGAEAARHLWLRIWRRSVMKKDVKRILKNYFCLYDYTVNQIEGILVQMLGTERIEDINRFYRDICYRKTNKIKAGE